MMTQNYKNLIHRYICRYMYVQPKIYKSFISHRNVKMHRKKIAIVAFLYTSTQTKWREFPYTNKSINKHLIFKKNNIDFSINKFSFDISNINN